MDVKEILKWAAIVTGAYLVYTYVIVPMTTTVAAAPAPTPTPLPTGTMPTATGTPVPTPTPTPATPAATNNTFQSGDFGTAAWMARVSSAMASAAGGVNQNFDNWSYYYQNQAQGSSISPTLFQGVLNAGAAQGLDRGTTITAPTFVGYLVTAVNASGNGGMGEIVYTGAGLSGLGNFWRT